MSNNSNSNSASDPGSVGSSSVTSTSIKDVSLEEIQNIRKKYTSSWKEHKNLNKNWTPQKNRNRFTSTEPEMKAVREKVIWYLKNKLDGGRDFKDIKSTPMYLMALEGKYIRNKLCDKGDQDVCDKAKDSVKKAGITLRVILKNKFGEDVTNGFFKEYAPNLFAVITHGQAGGRTRKGRKATRKGRKGTRRH